MQYLFKARNCTMISKSILLLILITTTLIFGYAPENVDPTVSHFPIIRGEGDIGYTGDMYYEIPIMNIPGINELNYDLKLQYVHGNGVPTSESATWVGLGWNLNEYKIVCSPIKGKEPMTGEFAQIYYDNDTGDPPASDMYYLTYPGGSTPFMKFMDGEDSIWLPVKWSAIDINPTSQLKSQSWDGDNYTDYDGFMVTDIDGTKYCFNKKLHKTSTDYLIYHFPSYPPNDEPYHYVFKLGWIASPDWVDVNSNGEPDSGDKGSWIKLDYFTSETYSLNSSDYSDTRMEISYLKKIITPTHTAIFTKITTNYDFLYRRQQLTSNVYLSKLTKIELYENSDLDNELLTVLFNYADSQTDFGWLEDFGGDPLEIYYRPTGRLKLNNIEIQDKNSQSIEKYTFTYEPEPLNSLGDQALISEWGHYIDINDDPTHPQNEYICWILKKVEVPTGGIIEFKHESDRYQTYFDSYKGASGDNTVLSGGYRLKWKRYYDPITASSDTFFYSYAHENNRHSGHGFVSSEPGGRFQNMIRTSFGLNTNSDVHYPDIIIENPDGSKIHKFYTSACSGVKIDANDYYWNFDVVNVDTYSGSPSLPSWPNYQGHYPFWYSQTLQEPFKDRFYSSYTSANDTKTGEILEFDDLNYRYNATAAGGVTFNCKSIDNSWKRGYITREVFESSSGTKIKEKNIFIQCPPLFIIIMI